MFILKNNWLARARWLIKRSRKFKKYDDQRNLRIESKRNKTQKTKKLKNQ